MSITREVVSYILGAKYQDIPPEAVFKTKELILDDIGNALGGSVIKSGQIILEWGKLLGGAPQATLLSDGAKVPVGMASGINTQLCMNLELMETYKNRGHPASGMSMTALAMGEHQKLPGKALIEAVCTSYDVTGRIIDATFPTQQYRWKVWNESWQGCGPLIVAIKLLGLDQEQAMHALGMGLGNAPAMNVHNILYVPGSMSKLGNQFHNFVGINAAYLAQLGYTGFFEILDEPYPYWTTISDQHDPAVYTQGLGEEFLIASVMAFKPWPTCRWAQAGIESLETIIREQGLGPDDIEQIVYRAHEKVTNFPFDNTAPSCPEDAYWSIPWSFGNTVLGHSPGPEWYLDQRFTDEALRQVMQKIRIQTLPAAVEAFAKEPEKSVTKVEVRTKGGESFSRGTEYCLGDPQKPLSHQGVINKFKLQTRQVIDEAQADRIIAMVDDLENLDDASRLAGLFA